MQIFVKVMGGAIFYMWIVEYEQAKQLNKQKHDVWAKGEHWYVSPRKFQTFLRYLWTFPRNGVEAYTNVT